jgi:hypothetical protein
MENIMNKLTHDLPVMMEAPGTMVRNGNLGGMAVGYLQLPAGTDFTPLFKGLPDDLCSCPHWGYVIKGAIHLKYTDGTVEVTPAGAVFYWPAGHTAWVEEDTVCIDFSPEDEFKIVSDHLARQAGQSA